MTVSELIEKFSYTPVAVPEGDREIHGCYIGDLLSWVMGKAQQDNAWITIMSNINITAVASLSDVAVIILAEGVTLDKAVTDTAGAKGINIVSSAKPAFEIAVEIARYI